MRHRGASPTQGQMRQIALIPQIPVPPPLLTAHSACDGLTEGKDGLKSHDNC